MLNGLTCASECTNFTIHNCPIIPQEYSRIMLFFCGKWKEQGKKWNKRFASAIWRIIARMPGLGGSTQSWQCHYFGNIWSLNPSLDWTNPFKAPNKFIWNAKEYLFSILTGQDLSPLKFVQYWFWKRIHFKKLNTKLKQKAKNKRKGKTFISI